VPNFGVRVQRTKVIEICTVADKIRWAHASAPHISLKEFSVASERGCKIIRVAFLKRSRFRWRHVRRTIEGMQSGRRMDQMAVFMIDDIGNLAGCTIPGNDRL